VLFSCSCWWIALQYSQPLRAQQHGICCLLLWRHYFGYLSSLMVAVMLLLRMLGLAIALTGWISHSTGDKLLLWLDGQQDIA
jgi:hypothetical protein